MRSRKREKKGGGSNGPCFVCSVDNRGVAARWASRCSKEKYGRHVRVTRYVSDESSASSSGAEQLSSVRGGVLEETKSETQRISNSNRGDRTDGDEIEMRLSTHEPRRRLPNRTRVSRVGAICIKHLSGRQSIDCSRPELPRTTHSRGEIKFAGEER